jgi:hypothetical protein
MYVSYVTGLSRYEDMTYCVRQDSRKVCKVALVYSQNTLCLDCSV